MTPLEAIMIVEGDNPTDDEEDIREAWQALVDTGLAWRLQGYFGRTVHDLLQKGFIHPYPRVSAPDNLKLN